MLRQLALLSLLLLPLALHARVLSYAPLTAANATPVVQDRTARYFALLETPVTGGATELVLYDSREEHEPRVIFSRTVVPEWNPTSAALWQRDGGLLILVQANTFVANQQRVQLFLSSDGGASWRTLVEGRAIVSRTFRPDTGGLFARSAPWQVFLGNAASPFVITTIDLRNTAAPLEVLSVSPDATLRRLAYILPSSGMTAAGIVGSNLAGSEFLLLGRVVETAQTRSNALRVLSLNGALRDVEHYPEGNPGVEGWITSDGSVYVDSLGFGGPRSLLLYRHQLRRVVATVDTAISPTLPVLPFFAIPTRDYEGAWIVRLGENRPTQLLRHSVSSFDPVEQWSDPRGPLVEALHENRAGSKLMIQVHKPRPVADLRLFVDPALAIWNVGTPAPERYEELYLNEGPRRSFVHLDVDAAEAGAPFYFDSAAFSQVGAPAPPISGGGGGGDVMQEWGVVRVRFDQQLVIGAIGRIRGAFGSEWRSDLILRNPEERHVDVTLRWVPNDGSGPREVALMLRPRQIVLERDVLLTLFGVMEGMGPMFIEPERGASVEATSRTYNIGADGTYGMTIPAVETTSASSARFPLYFSAAMPGGNFRTNVQLTNVSGREASVALRGAGSEAVVHLAPEEGMQISGLQTALNLSGWSGPSGGVIGALSGSVVGSVTVIDNITNDPTWFPPDLASTTTRILPIVGHVDGAFGSRFRTDLFLHNPLPTQQWVQISARRWSGTGQDINRSFTLAAGTTMMLRDVLRNTFGIEGLARLRIFPTQIRVASRSYNITPDGGTYGTMVPLLNSFQIGGTDDVLEILGGIADEGFRFNLGLIETSLAAGPAVPVTITIVDSAGVEIDSFVVDVPQSGGVQVNDVFRARGLIDRNEPLLVRVQTSRGSVGTWASLVDNGTNDPAYLGAQLQAKEN
jgi:hypothetical protein